MSAAGITFTPHETGEHLVNVFRNGKHIANSPFKIMVGESELGNASKVKVSGSGLTEGMANEINEFIVDTREAGQYLLGFIEWKKKNGKKRSKKSDEQRHGCVTRFWLFSCPLMSMKKWVLGFCSEKRKKKKK